MTGDPFGGGSAGDEPDGDMGSEGGLAAAAATELVDVIDERGEAIAVVTRAEMRAGRLAHRTVFVAVVGAADRLVVHQRAPWKDVWPSRWDVCFGGVLEAGEGWRAGAVRELAEEAGIVVADAELRYLWQGWFRNEAVEELGHVFLLHHDGPFTCPDGEVQAVDRVPLTDLPVWLGVHDVVDDSVALVVPSLLAARP